MGRGSVLNDLSGREVSCAELNDMVHRCKGRTYPAYDYCGGWEDAGGLYEEMGGGNLTKAHGCWYLDTGHVLEHGNTPTEAITRTWLVWWDVKQLGLR